MEGYENLLETICYVSKQDLELALWMYTSISCIRRESLHDVCLRACLICYRERDLRKYHVGRHTVPVGFGYQSPSFQTQPEPEPEPRGLTPMPDEPMAAEDLLDQPMSPVSAGGNSQQGIQPAEHKFEEVVCVSTISHGDQAIFSVLLIYPYSHTHDHDSASRQLADETRVGHKAHLRLHPQHQ